MATLLLPDIVHIICQYLPRTDLKSLRLASKEHFLPLVSPHLFRTVYLSFDIHTFDHFEYFAEHPTYSQYIQSISLDGRLMGDWSVGMGVAYWTRTNAGLGLFADKHGGKVEQFLQDLDTGLQEKYYAGYISHIAGQEYLRSGKHLRRILTQQIKNLPALQEISLVTKDSILISDDDLEIPLEQNLKNRSSIARRTLSEPLITVAWDRHCLFFNNLLEATELSGRSNQITRITASSITFEYWLRDPYTLKFCSTPHPHITHLSLELDPFRGASNPIGSLGSLLTQSPNLISLTLFFLNTRSVEKQWEHSFLFDSLTTTYLPDFTPTEIPIHFRSLKHLSLMGFHLTQHSFQSFLLLHSPTLKSLLLENLSAYNRFIPATPSSPPPTGSWLSIFGYISQNLSLTTAKISGSLFNGPNEPWTQEAFNMLENAFRPGSYATMHVNFMGSYMAHRLSDEGMRWMDCWVLFNDMMWESCLGDVDGEGEVWQGKCRRLAGAGGFAGVRLHQDVISQFLEY